MGLGGLLEGGRFVGFLVQYHGGWGLYRVEFLCHEFCAKFLCTICLGVLRICKGMRWAVSFLTCTMPRDLANCD